jgi:hypothetical protein
MAQKSIYLVNSFSCAALTLIIKTFQNLVICVGTTFFLIVEVVLRQYSFIKYIERNYKTYQTSSLKSQTDWDYDGCKLHHQSLIRRLVYEYTFDDNPKSIRTF